MGARIDTPHDEALLEYRRSFVTLCALGAAAMVPVSLFARNPENTMNFNDPEVVRQTWVVNDGVMGGRSHSRFTPHPDGLVFEGAVSLENNGGFASVRCPAHFPLKTSLLQLTARGDGKRYQFIIRTEPSALAPLYKCNFVATAEWQTHVFRAQDFEASFRGRTVDARPLVFSDATEIGVLIADKQAGEFRLQLRQISAG